MSPEQTTKKDSSFKTELLRLEFQRHNIEQFTGARRVQKATRLEFFVDRAIERGLTEEMVAENLAAGRPPLFVETGE